MTPLAAIAALDRQIAAHGQMVTLQRGDASSTVRAIVRGYRREEFVGGIEQGDTQVVVSPSSLRGTVFAPAGPVAGDEVTINGRLRVVRPYEPLRIGGAIVRFDVPVVG